jgi:hypothetical protein
MQSSYHTSSTRCDVSRPQTSQAAHDDELPCLPDYLDRPALESLGLDQDAVAALLARSGGAPLHRDDLPDRLALIARENFPTPSEKGAIV